MNGLAQDIKFGIRMLVKNPGFALVVIVTLGLGIGLNTAIFSLVNAVLFRPLPFDDVQQLVELNRGEWNDFFSYPDYAEYRDRSGIFSELSAWSYAPISIGIGDTTELRFGQIVTGNYFDVLRVHAQHGRMLTSEDDKVAGRHPVAVISHGYWQGNCGGDPSVVGKSISLNGGVYRIIGVAPEGFVGAYPAFSPDVWVPMMMEAQIMPEGGQLENRGSGWLRVIGRLKPGVTLEQAQARLDQITPLFKEIDPKRYADESAFVVHPSGIGLPPEARPATLAASALIMLMVGLVLLIACANVANLFLARSTARRGEIAIRLALGAGRLRLVRQLLAESMLLAVCAGAVGVLIAGWAVTLAGALLPELPYKLSLAMEVSLDKRVLTFAVLISVLTGLVFGLVPALQATRADVAPALKDDVGARSLGLKRMRLQNSLVVTQVGISLVLLVCASLFVRSLRTAKAIDPGFDHENVLAVSLAFQWHEKDVAAGQAFYRDLLDRVRAMPGVESASLNECIPLGFTMSGNNYWIEGRAPQTNADGEEETVSAFKSTVSASDFKTLGIPLLRGRDFNELDTEDAPGVVVINKAFADREWPGEDPLGKRFSIEAKDGPLLEVVGVVATAKYIFIGEDPRPYFYLPFSQHFEPNVTLLVRATGAPMSLVAPIRAALTELNSDIEPSDTRLLTGWIGFALLPARFAAALFGTFGVLAIVLASVGLYGVMSYTVGQRTREMGIRMALGAQRRDVLSVVLRKGLTLAAIGLAVGLVISLFGTRVLAVLLYDVSSSDPLTFVGVSVLLMAVALLACYIPARRATKVDPIIALRYE